MKLIKVVFYRMQGMRRTPGAEEDDYLDMLRYDLAFVPKGGGRTSIVAFPTFGGKGGRVGGDPTHDRWESFLVKLTPITGDEADRLRADFSGAWVTALHPRDADGRADYGKLVKVSLDRVLTARDLFDVATGTGKEGDQ